MTGGVYMHFIDAQQFDKWFKAYQHDTVDSVVDVWRQMRLHAEEMFLNPEMRPDSVFTDYTAFYKGKEDIMNKINIKKVIFNDPVTVVLWTDGTKTVVRTQNGEKFDPEKGLAMAIAKKILGNTGKYYNVFKKWIEQGDENDT